MNTKAFMVLLVGVLVLGGGLGGAFAGGVALGKSQAEEAPSSSLPQSTTSLAPQLSRQFSQEQLDQFLQQLRGQFGRGFAGRGGLTGTIETIEGDTVTLNTPQGPLQATIGADTTIQVFAEGTRSDLQAGLRVAVVGQRGEDGIVEARSILITPEGAGGFFSGDRQQRDQQSP